MSGAELMATIAKHPPAILVSGRGGVLDHQVLVERSGRHGEHSPSLTALRAGMLGSVAGEGR